MGESRAVYDRQYDRPRNIEAFELKPLILHGFFMVDVNVHDSQLHRLNGTFQKITTLVVLRIEMLFNA